MFRFLPRLAVDRPVLATMLGAVFVVLGVYTFIQLRVDLFPDVEFPVVSVSTPYPGAGPEEVESQVTERLEDAVSNLAGLDELTSFSREGMSILILQFDLEVDPDLAAIDVKDQVDAVRGMLPDAAEVPVIQKFDIDAFPIMSIALAGPQGVDPLFELADDQIRERLSRVDGVARVDVVGGREREIHVLPRPTLLEAYGITLADIVRLIGQENVTVPGGRIEEDRVRTPVRVVGEYADAEELRDLRLFLPEGGVVRLEEVAEIREGWRDAEQIARYNGEPSVSISIQRQADANTVVTAGLVRAELADIEEELVPSGAELAVVQDGSEFIGEAIEDVLWAMAVGILLTTLILFAFLHSWRGTLIAAIAMPATVVSSFLLIYAAGFTLNVMTLLALGVTVGILVTNTIVVLENIYRYLDLGHDPKEAAVEGTAEVAIAVAASALTNVVVFSPIAFMGGVIGQFFYAFGLTVVFATIFSLLISFLLAPLLGARLLRPGESRRAGGGRLGPLWRAWNRGYEGLTESYRSGLGWALARPRNGWMVIGGVGAFFVGSLVLAGAFIQGEFLPEADEGVVQITLELPPESSLEHTGRAVALTERLVEGIDEVEHVLSAVAAGTGFMAVAEAANMGEVLLTLRDDRERSTDEVVREARPLVAAVPDAEVTVVSQSSVGGPGVAAPVIIRVTGPPEELEDVTGRITEVMAGIPNLTDVRNTMEPPVEELVFRPDRGVLADRGLTVGEVGQVVRTSIEGEVAGVFRQAGDEFDIRVRLPHEEREDPSQVQRLLVRSAVGSSPLTALGEIATEDAVPAVRRIDRQRSYDVEAEIATGSLTEAVAAVESELGEVPLPPGYSWQVTGEFEDFADALAEILQALLLAIILTYIVLAMILESFVHPVTIMLTLPLGASGALLALILADVPLNIFAMMAIVMLVGIVVNNAILILDYAAQLRAKGKAAVEALLEAAPVRLRPIIMSNVAIAVALVPQALGTGDGAAFRVPMAVVTIGGVSVAAVFTLFLIPVIYLKVDAASEWARARTTRLRAALGGSPEETSLAPGAGD